MVLGAAEIVVRFLPAVYSYFPGAHFLMLAIIHLFSLFGFEEIEKKRSNSPPNRLDGCETFVECILWSFVEDIGCFFHDSERQRARIPVRGRNEFMALIRNALAPCSRNGSSLMLMVRTADIWSFANFIFITL